MKLINVEITMAHEIGVSASYYRPTEKEVLEDYIKAIPLLSITTSSAIALQKQVVELLNQRDSMNASADGQKMLEDRDKLILDLRKKLDLYASQE